MHTRYNVTVSSKRHIKLKQYLYGFQFTCNIIYLNIQYCITNALQSKQVFMCKIKRDAVGEMYSNIQNNSVHEQRHQQYLTVPGRHIKPAKLAFDSAEKEKETRRFLGLGKHLFRVDLSQEGRKHYPGD